MSEPEEHPDDPHIPAEDLPPPPSAREKAMGFWEHLEELRMTIIKSVIAFLVCATVIGYYCVQFNDVIIMRPLAHVQAEYPNFNIELNAMTVMEPFNIIVQMCLLGGLILASPFILFFIGQFVAPALTEKEMKAVAPMCFWALVLFLAGAAFSYFILLPSMLRVSAELTNMLHLRFTWTAASYYNVLLVAVLGVGAAFEFPLVIVLLVWLGVMSTAFLRKYRRHAIVVIFIIAAVVTPTADPLNQTLFAGPLWLLYEIAIIVARRVEKKRERRIG